MKKRDEELHRLHDGDHEGHAKDAAAPGHALGDDDRARLAAMAGVGEAVRRSVDGLRAAHPLDGDALWSAIEARLPASATADTPRGMTATTRPSSPRREADGERGAARWWRRPALRRAWIALPAMAAAAAGAIVRLNVGAHPTNGCDIEELDVTGVSATVLQVGDPKDATTVIWTQPEPEGAL